LAANSSIRASMISTSLGPFLEAARRLERRLRTQIRRCNLVRIGMWTSRGTGIDAHEMLGPCMF
jgi:hypothetical protein